MLQYLGCALSVTLKGGKTSLCSPHNKATWGNCSCEVALHTYAYIYIQLLYIQKAYMQMVLGVHVTVMQIIENTEDNTATLWTSKSILFTQWTSPFIFLGWLDVLLINS